MEQKADVVNIEDQPDYWKKHWDEQIVAAQKRLRTFQKQGSAVVDRYLDDRESNADPTIRSNNNPSKLNLFYTNVMTMQSMLYGSTPKVDVTREHHDPDDDVARVAGLMYQRILQADVEPSGENVPTVLKACLQDRLLPGLGIARVRYDMATTMTTVLNPATMEMEETEEITYEDAPIDYVHWQDFLWGWARTWAEVPWMAFRAHLTKREAAERFGQDIANRLEYKNQTPSGTGKEEGNDAKDQQNITQKAAIWEIWCYRVRRVFWYAEGAPALLDMREDPLKLDGFWPVPKPLLANCTTKMLVPRADFVLSQDLYNEIDELQTRISMITHAIKVVGVYDSSSGSAVGRMLKEGNENDLIPVDNWAMFAERGGLKGTIDWFPVETIANVLQTLTGIQGQKIQQLYEVTGLSDILRGGNTDQYAAKGTQAMKLKMGSIRIQALQDEFARFASDLEAIKAEVISKHFQKESIVKQSGAMFLPQPDKQLISPALELMQSPELKWRVDIRPESIAMVDYAQLKSERSEFLTSMATYLQSMTSMVQSVPESLPVLLEMLKWGMAGFKGSNYLEGIMDQAITMAQQKPPGGDKEKGPSPEETKLQVEQLKAQTAQQKGQLELQKIQAKAQADLQTLQTKLQGEMQKIQVDAGRDQSLEQVQANNRLREIAEELQSSLVEIRASMQADLEVERAQSEYAIAERQVEHGNTMREQRAQIQTNNQP